METKLGQSTAALAAADKRANALRAGFEGLPERLPTDEIKGFPNAAADSMRQDLYQLEIREAELASRFTDEFPALVAVREQIKTAKAPLTKEEQRRTQSTTTVNSVHNQIKLTSADRGCQYRVIERPETCAQQATVGTSRTCSTTQR